MASSRRSSYEQGGRFRAERTTLHQFLEEMHTVSLTNRVPIRISRSRAYLVLLIGKLSRTEEIPAFRPYLICLYFATSATAIVNAVFLDTHLERAGRC